MSLDKKDFSIYIKQFNFRELFNDMGWNNDKTTQPIVVDNETYTLQAVAEKSGFKILLCNPLANGLIPDYNTRKKIETKVTKLFQEHLIIFFDSKKTEQIWQLVVRQSGKPTKVTETRWHINQDPELLYQRAAGIFFELDEEEHITIIDVTKRIADNFHQNNERVTKQFYDKFKKEHGAFLQFIKGISDKTNQEWYASLMLNRLMFCYFIQKKGFLDNNKNYLRDKLLACKAKKGKVKFYSFYRDFLLVLFHKGLNEPTQSPDTKIEIGKIPYLNGGLFDEHELEKNNDSIDIDDKAFERLFDFFDQYEWHLDTRHTASGKDINPDVIGYIFEKYINDRANMGAYYTKEDITDYISKNCILPYLFDETKRHYPKAFNADSEVWQMVKQSGKQYIYDAVKKGVEEPLPKEIEQGIKDVSKRSEWNKPATINYALPTEIWREVVDRRNRYTEVKSKIDNGDIQHINDFITYNLNIRQFAQDVVENTNDPELLKHFYKALNSVTIIDPTCGSGAFLFAAMNILEPLYESCLQRMENFVAEAPKGKYKFFEETLAQVKSPEHPNLQYFIYKSIILRNLYGVDIMKEAVEIAKLRLFLKLVATVEADYRKPNLGLEPLPDIDFNIRAGNTLVGFATETELRKGLKWKLDFDGEEERINEKCEIVSNAFKRYKEIQLTYGDDFQEFKKAKSELNKRLKELNHELNQLLHKQADGLKYEAWLQSHQPFHWFAEFYEIVQEKGGFDVVIGNPPYVVYTKKDSKTKMSIADRYKLTNFETLPTNNLYSFVIERSSNLLNRMGKLGMIVPIASVSTEAMKELQNLYSKKFSSQWHSNYSTRPGKLFAGVDMNLTISILTKTDSKSNFVTDYTRWYDGENKNRAYIFDLLNYVEFINSVKFQNNYPKFSKKIEIEILKKMLSHNKKLSFFYSNIGSNVFYHSGGRYWRKAIDQSFSSHYKKITLVRENLSIALCLLNSQLFYWYWISNSNCMDVVSREVDLLPVFNLENKFEEFNSLASQLLESYFDNTENRVRLGEIINTTEVNFDIKKSKPIIDEIDTVLAKYYGFTDEELDFIINYDIKYRMGKELENEDEA
ncbi:MAG: DNA methyltransferase [Chloroherpetonaceae bacterium]|nr:DNA methyltransferase [Chloroherpetonaceae bacterium]